MFDSAATWLARSVYPILFFSLIGAVFYFPDGLATAFKVAPEVWLVTSAWLVTGVVATARALAGKPILGGADRSPFWLALLGFVVVMGLTASLGLAPDQAWAQVMGVLAYLFAARSLQDWMDEAPGRRGYVVALLGLLVAAESALALVELARWKTMLWGEAHPALNTWFHGLFRAVDVSVAAGAPFGTLGNVNYMAELLVLSIPVLLTWNLESRKRQLFVAPLLLVPLGIMVACGTRSAALGCLVGAAGGALLVFGKQALNPKAWFASAKGRVALVVAFLAVIGVIAFAGNTLASKLSYAIDFDNSESSRLVNWYAAAGLVAERPLLGAGIGSYKLRNTEKLAALYPNGMPEHLTTTRFIQAHHDPLQLVTETGLLGGAMALAAFIFWLLAVRANQSLTPLRRWGLLWGLIALVVASCFGFPFHVPLTAFVVMVVLACGLANPRPEGSPEEFADDMPTWARLPYALLTAAVIGLIAFYALSRGVFQLYTANHYAYLAKLIDQTNVKADGADTLFGLAARTDRFASPQVFQQMKAQFKKKRYQAVLDTYAQWQKTGGLGMDSLIIQASALAELGRKDEAISAFKRVVNYYPVDSNNRKAAIRRLGKLGVSYPFDAAPDPATSGTP